MMVPKASWCSLAWNKWVRRVGVGGQWGGLGGTLRRCYGLRLEKKRTIMRQGRKGTKSRRFGYLWQAGGNFKWKSSFLKRAKKRFTQKWGQITTFWQTFTSLSDVGYVKGRFDRRWEAETKMRCCHEERRYEWHFQFSLLRAHSARFPLPKNMIVSHCDVFWAQTKSSINSRKLNSR